MKEGLFLHINLRNEHNHHLSCAGLVRRDVSGETIEKLKKLFELGHTPSSALRELKHNLQVQEKDNYVNAAADRSICPDLPFCYRLVTYWLNSFYSYNALIHWICNFLSNLFYIADCITNFSKRNTMQLQEKRSPVSLNKPSMITTRSKEMFVLACAKPLTISWWSLCALHWWRGSMLC